MFSYNFIERLKKNEKLLSVILMVAMLHKSKIGFCVIYTTAVESGSHRHNFRGYAHTSMPRHDILTYMAIYTYYIGIIPINNNNNNNVQYSHSVQHIICIICIMYIVYLHTCISMVFDLGI